MYDRGVEGNAGVKPNGGTGPLVALPFSEWTVNVSVTMQDHTNSGSGAYDESAPEVNSIEGEITVKPSSGLEVSAANGLEIGALVDLKLVKSATKSWSGPAHITGFGTNSGAKANGEWSFNYKAFGSWVGPGLPAVVVPIPLGS